MLPHVLRLTNAEILLKLDIFVKVGGRFSYHEVVLKAERRPNPEASVFGSSKGSALVFPGRPVEMKASDEDECQVGLEATRVRLPSQKILPHPIVGDAKVQYLN